MKTILLFLATATSILAHDILPPSWRANSIKNDWQFSTNSNPALSGSSYDAKIVLGSFASGWFWNFPLGTNSGYWDLGRTGRIEITFSNIQKIRIQSTEWYDGGIFNQFASNSIPGGVKISESYTNIEGTFLGSWVLHQTEYSISNDCEFTLISAWNGTIIDSLVIDVLPVGASLWIESSSSATGPWEVITPSPVLLIPHSEGRKFYRIKITQ